MKISFDPVKRAATLANSDLDLVDAVQVFAGLTFTQKDIRFDDSEERFQTYGCCAAVSSWLFGLRSPRHFDEEMQ